MEDIYGYPMQQYETRIKEATIILIPNEKYYGMQNTNFISGILENVWINIGDNPYVDFTLSWKGQIILAIKELRETKVFFPTCYTHDYDGHTYSRQHSKKWAVNGSLLLEVIARNPVEVTLQWQ